MYIEYKHYLRAAQRAHQDTRPPKRQARPLKDSWMPLQRRAGAALRTACAAIAPPAPPPEVAAPTPYQRVWQLLRWIRQGAAPLTRVQKQLDEAHRLTLRAQDQENMARDLQRRATDLLKQASANHLQAREAEKEAEHYLRRAKRRLREAWEAPARIPVSGPQLNVIHALAPWGVRANQINALDSSLEGPITHLLEDLFDLAEAAGVDTRKLVRRAQAIAPGSDIKLEIKRDYWKYIDPHHDVSLDL